MKLFPALQLLFKNIVFIIFALISDNLQINTCSNNIYVWLFMVRAKYDDSISYQYFFARSLIYPFQNSFWKSNLDHPGKHNKTIKYLVLNQASQNIIKSLISKSRNSFYFHYHWKSKSNQIFLSHHDNIDDYVWHFWYYQ